MTIASCGMQHDLALICPDCGSGTIFHASTPYPWSCASCRAVLRERDARAAAAGERRARALAWRFVDAAAELA